jgi:hypothetical protein|tara:strand:+ start:719 stop:1126 length:408 start_codon:yes stop_codon:yes gene_type:complete
MAYGTSGSSAEGKTLFSNLAVGKTTDSKAIVQFLEGLSEERVEFSASEYDAVVGFFEGKEYTRESAQSIGYILLKQAKTDNVPIFQVLDTLGKATPVVLSQLVAEILNANRYKTSVLGYKQARDTADHINRNIKA